MKQIFKSIVSVLFIFIVVVLAVTFSQETAFASKDAIVVAQDKKVAVVGNTYYTSLSDAIKKAAGSEVKLLEDITLTSPISVSMGQTSVNLNLNGKSINVSGSNERAFEVTRELGEVFGVFRIYNSNSVSSSLNGEIYINNNSPIYIEKSLFNWNKIKYSKTYTPCVYSGDGEGYFVVVRTEENHLYNGSIYRASNIYFDSKEDGESLKTVLGLDSSSTIEQWGYKIRLHDINPSGVETKDYGFLLYLKKGESIKEGIIRQRKYIENNFPNYLDDDLRVFSRPSYAGYVLDGWYTATINRDSISGDITAITYKLEKSFNTVPTSDLDLYSKWTSNAGVKNVFGTSSTIRFFGTNRYATAEQIAGGIKSALGISKFETVIVACGSDYADALSASYLAKIKNAPILLVDKGRETQVINYINNNLKSNGNIYIIGGTGAVSDDFANNSQLSKYTIKRLGGANRFETNLAILKETGVGDKDIMVCSAFGFADSLSASATGNPILLVGKTLTDEQTTYINSLSKKNYYIIGGTSVVSVSIRNSLNINNNTVARIYGQNRYETSVAIANQFFPNGSDAVVLAYGLDFPDGLCGAALAMTMESPLILVDGNNTSYAKEYVKYLDISKAAILGGTGVLPDSIVDAVIK
jgi:putative cell wall-binding protein